MSKALLYRAFIATKVIIAYGLFNLHFDFGQLQLDDGMF